MVRNTLLKNGQENNMKTIRFTIGQLSHFRPIVKTPREIPISDSTNVLDIIAMLDQEFQHKTSGDGIDHSEVFLDGKIKTLMQLLWNPNDQRFYDDVGVEARTAPPESNSIRIDTNWKTPISDGAWIVLTPDAGC
jgi:hypothetical protein